MSHGAIGDERNAHVTAPRCSRMERQQLLALVLVLLMLFSSIAYAFASV
ncbi:hypothetical protein [Haloplanus halobius]|nr:hypothetical protein [Haloplanus sp. XH21]